MSLPVDAELFESSEKRYDEIIVFVHHQTGSKRTVKRHVECVNKLGFDAVAFTLEVPDYMTLRELPVSAALKFGLKHYWADKIAQVLNHYNGPKIVFAFSNPCSSAIEAIAQRNAFDVTGLVCDGGPTSQVFVSTLNYFQESGRFGWLPTKLLTAGGFTLGWSWNNLEEMHEDLDRLRLEFPILSIRGWRDNVIPPAYIDQVFSPHRQLDWRKMNLPEAGHLDGLKNFEDEYVPQLNRFLTSIAKPLQLKAADS